jgi:hypothetical protein
MFTWEVAVADGARVVCGYVEECSEAQLLNSRLLAKTQSWTSISGIVINGVDLELGRRRWTAWGGKGRRGSHNRRWRRSRRSSGDR